MPARAAGVTAMVGPDQPGRQRAACELARTRPDTSLHRRRASAPRARVQRPHVASCATGRRPRCARRRVRPRLRPQLLAAEAAALVRGPVDLASSCDAAVSARARAHAIFWPSCASAARAARRVIHCFTGDAASSSATSRSICPSASPAGSATTAAAATCATRRRIPPERLMIERRAVPAAARPHPPAAGQAQRAGLLPHVSTGWRSRPASRGGDRAHDQPTARRSSGSILPEAEAAVTGCIRLAAGSTGST